MRKLFCFLLFFINLVAIAPIFAQTTKPSSAPATAAKSVSPIPNSAFPTPHSTYAVVIGISDYQDPAIPDLQFAHKDAQAFSAWLQSPAGGNLPADHIELLLNEKATMGRVAMALWALLSQCKEGDQALIYFSGHGDVETKTMAQPGYWLCWDAPPYAYMSGGCFNVRDLQDIVSTLSNQNKVRVLLIADACHAGKLAGSEVGGPQATTSNLSKQFANEVKILSCQPSEFSLEGVQWGGGRGCFSFHLMDGLYGLADRNSDQRISLLELENYLEDRVPAETAPHPQLPFVVGNKTAEMAMVDPVTLARIKAGKSGVEQSLEKIEPRGMYGWILAQTDSSIMELYAAFNAALEKKELLTPLGKSANDYYLRLIQEPTLEPLHGLMTRNFAAALVDESQQVTNKLLKTDIKVVSDIWSCPFVFNHIPAYLERATDLLGEQHFLYRYLKAKQLFFEGLTAYVKDNSEMDADKRFESVRAKMEEGLQLDSMAAYVYAYLANFYISDYHDQERSLRCAEKAVALSPNWALAHYIAGFSFGSYGFYQNDTTYKLKAEQHLLTALELDSSFVFANQGLSWLYYQVIPNRERYQYFQNKYILSVQCLLKSDPEKVTVFHRACLGVELFRAGRLAEAASVLEACEQLTDNKYNVVYQYLGAIYIGLGEYEKALRVAKRQLELNPFNVEGFHQLAGVYELLNLPLKVVETAEKGLLVLERMPYERGSSSYFVIFYTKIGNAYKQLGRDEEGKAQFQKLLEVLPDFSNALEMNFVGRAWIGLENFDAMQKTIEEGLKKFPDDAMVYYQAACLYSLANQVQKSLEWLELAINKGYKDVDWIQADSDLDNVCNTPGFKALLKKYFPDQVKD